VNYNSTREEYRGQPLDVASVNPDPIIQFQVWMTQAIEAELREPNAMTLATATADGDPSARMVLLKGIDEGGFVFFTNYLSRKARDIAANPRAELVFYWNELSRQVRIHGLVSKVSQQASEQYFRSRPYLARLGAVVSQQSSELKDRAELERRMLLLEAEYEGADVPLPEHWGGYRVTPDRIEFWQGRMNRLHDRLQYRLDASKQWAITRLYP
jgi:pyridoxamine 5'-phosphate oxidase